MNYPLANPQYPTKRQRRARMIASLLMGDSTGFGGVAGKLIVAHSDGSTEEMEYPEVYSRIMEILNIKDV